MRVLACYDIVSDRRRARVHQLLSKHGIPVQYSVFECELDRSELDRLKAEIRTLVAPNRDSVLFYPLCASCRARVFAIPQRSKRPRSAVV